ncbi:MAG TPA: aquaporin [Polyangiaceae bacterium]|jgi:aquaporin Z|nr:aquaporin [Polyangiaceae bacterium]
MMDQNRMTATDELTPDARMHGGPHADAFVPVRFPLVMRRLVTESIGTFVRVVVNCSGAIIAVISPTEVTSVARALATGLVVMAMSMVMADVSGAHFNPATTLAFAFRKAFPWKMVPAYWTAQLVGAFGAAGATLAIFGDVAHDGATLPKHGEGLAFAIELFITLVIVIVSLGTATRHRILGAQAALAIGGATTACELIARPISGAGMNPARSLAPALLGHATGGLWIYVLAPFAASLVGCGIIDVVHRKKHSEERAAAGGEPK